MIYTISSEDSCNSTIEELKTVICYNRVWKVIELVENTFKCFCNVVTTFSLHWSCINHSTKAINHNQDETISLISIDVISLRVFNQISLKYLKWISRHNFTARKCFFYDSSMYTVSRIFSEKFSYFC